MFHHQVFAQIKNEKVENIIVCANYQMANTLAKKVYGKDAISVECTYWDCAIGDTYRDNTFYDKEGNKRNYIGTEEENIKQLQTENEELKRQSYEDNDAILDLDYRVSVLEG